MQITLTITQEHLIEIMDLARKHHRIARPTDGIQTINVGDFDPKEYLESPEHKARLELKQAIDSLSPGEKYDLAAIAWVGRDNEGDDFLALRKHAMTFDTAETGRYLSEKLPLDVYLANGLAKIAAPRGEAEQEATDD